MPDGPDRQSPPARLLLLFDTTHAAMEAEEAIINGGFWCDVVPRPPAAAAALCGLAIEIDPGDRQDISGMLSRAGIEFQAYLQEGERDV